MLPGLPEAAAHGLFAAPRRLDVLIRLSNGAVAVQSDRTPDIRGFAIKVLGVEGPAALGGTTQAQDFLLINREIFGFKEAAAFVALATASSHGLPSLAWHMILTHGFFRGLAELKRLNDSIGRPFSGFLSETFSSAAPIAIGPYAAQLRLVPSAVARPHDQGWKENVRAHLAAGPVSMELQLQFFVDEATTPIEDASVGWSAPWVTVARLNIPPQDLEDAAFAAEVERDSFDPWIALAAHRPLGQIMRARKAAYFASQKGRKTS